MRKLFFSLLLVACGGKIEGQGDAALEGGADDSPFQLLEGGLDLGPCNFSSAFKPNGDPMTYPVADIKGTMDGRRDAAGMKLTCAGSGNGGFYYMLFFDPMKRMVGHFDVSLYMLINSNGREAEDARGTCAIDIASIDASGNIDGAFDCPKMTIISGDYKLRGTFTAHVP